MLPTVKCCLLESCFVLCGMLLSMLVDLFLPWVSLLGTDSTSGTLVPLVLVKQGGYLALFVYAGNKCYSLRWVMMIMKILLPGLLVYLVLVHILWAPLISVAFSSTLNFLL
jgi:hypothetical protein